MMHAELQATCSALGYLDDGQYYKEPDCLETVKDLIRFLKREDESCDIRRQLGHAQILQNDLVPILKAYKDEHILWETVIRLMVNLTQPAVLCFQNQIPEDKATRNFYLEIESDLQAYKEAFADEGLFAVLAGKLGELLQLDWESRQEEDRTLIERLLLLVRNILHVPPNQAKEQRTDDDASVHDQVLWALHVSGMEDLLLYIASSSDERSFSFHCLEIISLMFREQTPEQLASAGGNRSSTEKEKDERELLLEREKERAQKRAHVFKNSTRHSRFGGTYVLASMKSISDRDVIFHKSVTKVKDVSFDDNKKRVKKAKNRRPITEKDTVRRSTLSIRIFLKEFCIQFLENCYNPLMAAVKDTLVRERAQENDETYYLWAMRFFMEFQRLYKFKVDFVSETLSVQAFHYIQTQLLNFHEMILTNKKEGIIWARRLHLALKAYSELLHNLNMMDKSKDEAIRSSAQVIKGNVFYMMEYRDIFVILLKKFDERRQSRTYLKDLVECTHLFLKMLDTHCKVNRHLIVQKKKRKAGPRKKKEPRPGSGEPNPQELEDLWDTVSGELSAIFQGRGADLPENVAPFDAASEVDVDQQRAEAMIKIQDCLRGNRPGEAVATFRAAREVWPEREEFGSVDISAEDEFMSLREVFYADLPRAQREEPREGEEEEQPEVEDEEVVEEELAAVNQFSEQEFNFKEFLLRFANPATVCACVTLLADWKKNSVYTNHCVVKMLHRFAFDQHIPGLIFQLQLFRIFQKIMTDPVAKASQFQELHIFAKHVLRSFFEVAEKNPKIFVELLFWKSLRDATEITEGYGSTVARSKAAKVLWTEEQEMEITRLAEQYEADGPHEGVKDLADFVTVNLIDQSKTRRQVIKQLIRQNLIGSAKELYNKKSGSGRSQKWDEWEEAELRAIFERVITEKDPLTLLTERLTTPRSKPSIVKKCLELGLVQDRAELHVKRGGGGGGSRRKKDPFMERPDDELLPTTDDSSDSDAMPPGGSSDSDESQDEAPSYVKQTGKLANQMRANGFGGSVVWIQRSLQEVAEDREADGDTENIPVVPMTEETENAMDNAAFQKLLKKLGVTPPADEQERYWRIPGHVSPADLRSRAAALEVGAAAEEEGTAEEEGGKGAGDSRKHKLQAMAKQRRKERKEGKKRKTNRSTQKTPTPSSRSRRQDSSSDDDDNLDRFLSNQRSHENQASPPVKVKPKVKSGKRRVRKASPPSDDSGDDEPAALALTCSSQKSNSSTASSAGKRAMSSDSEGPNSDLEKTSPKQSQKKKRAKIVESDSEASIHSNTENVDPNKHTAESFPATMLTQPVGSDSESDVEDHIPLKRALRARINSDSE